jgi:hypothetical protein
VKTVEVAVYKGDTFLTLGTVKECADYLGMKEETLKFYLTPTYRKRLEKRKKSKNPIIVIRIDD